MKKLGGSGPWILTVAVLLAALVGLVVAWGRNDWSLDAAALTGDATGPLVGIASLAAVVAALWSVRQQGEAVEIQAEALANQEREIRAQNDAFTAQIKIQQESLELQRKALDAEIAHRRQASLLEAYAPLFSAIDAWLTEVDSYWKATFQYPDALSVDRAGWMQPVVAAHDAVQRCLASVRLVDPRRAWKAYKAARDISLIPVVDTPANHVAFRDVIHYKMLDRRTKATELQAEIRAEMGLVDTEPEERPAEAIAFDKRMMADAKAKADAADADIQRQYREMAAAAYAAGTGTAAAMAAKSPTSGPVETMPEGSEPDDPDDK